MFARKSSGDTRAACLRLSGSWSLFCARIGPAVPSSVDSLVRALTCGRGLRGAVPIVSFRGVCLRVPPRRRDVEIDANIKTLAEKGVAYVTVAHLFHRQVAKNSPALPFLRWDWVYKMLLPQPRHDGLSRRGEAPCARWQGDRC
jgi:hypothetical protein